jgi:hypothetical protein
MRQIGEFVWRKHAAQRMMERSIAREEIIHCAQYGEIIESYPNDYPFPSFLVFEMGTEPLHIVMALDGDTCYVITAYRPNNQEFENDFKTRKKQ